MTLRVGDVIEGKYEILKQIGQGGMATVYLSIDSRLNKQWAIKEIVKSNTKLGKIEYRS
ncbi:serine/threonine protein kinase, partial [Bacillus thuringiensis]|nr:serine/threonine protein kinase [Bacillus thuringiensis]